MTQSPPEIAGLTILGIRGEGATSTVWSARRDLDGWPCAVKVMREDAGAQAAREAEVLTAVRVPGLVRLHGVTRCADGRVALILDLVDGGVLREVVSARGHLTLRESVGVLRVVFGVLAALHARGVSHGDVSVGNVLISRDGRSVLGDMGGARLVGEATAEICGTRGFIAPEVLCGGAPSPAADVYAAGALAWLLLTGEVPGPGYARRPAAEALEEAPAALVRLVEECLAGEPGHRPDARQAGAVCADLGPEEPLRLPDGPDLGGRLTHRLRWQVAELADASGSEEAVLPAVAPLGTRPGDVGEGEGGHGRHGRHRGAAPGAWAARASRVAAPLVGVPGRTAAAVVAGALAGLALWWGLGAWRAGSPALPTHVPGTGIALPWAGSAAPSAADPPPDATPRAGRGEAPTPDPADVLDRLLRARATAFERADPAALEECYADGAALVAARTDVQRLRDGAVRYEGLSYRVLSARSDPPTGQGEEREWRVTAQVGSTAYRAVTTGPDGGTGPSAGRPEPTSRAGAQPQELTYVLRDRGHGWRVVDILPPG